MVHPMVGDDHEPNSRGLCTQHICIYIYKYKRIATFDPGTNGEVNTIE